MKKEKLKNDIIKAKTKDEIKEACDNILKNGYELEEIICISNDTELFEQITTKIFKSGYIPYDCV